MCAGTSMRTSSKVVGGVNGRFGKDGSQGVEKSMTRVVVGR